MKRKSKFPSADVKRRLRSAAVKRLSLFRVSDKSKLDMVTVERDEENKVEDDGQLSGERYEQLTLQLARTQYR